MTPRLACAGLCAIVALLWIYGCPGPTGGGPNTNTNTNVNVNNNSGTGGGGGVGNQNANSGNDNTNDNPPPANDAGAFPADRLPTLTGVGISADARVELGDDLIAFTGAGSNGVAGVQYIVPSQGGLSAQDVSESERFDANNFIVAGGKIVLLGDTNTTGRDFAVTVFDPTDESLAPIPVADIRLAIVPNDPFAPGFMVADGPMVATINKSGVGGAEGDELIRVIDVSGPTPQTIRFAVNPESDNLSTIAQVMIDAPTRTVVVARVLPKKLYVYDIDFPAMAPVEFDLSATSDLLPTESPFAFDDGVLLYTGRLLGNDTPFVLDVSAPTNQPEQVMTDSRGADQPQLLGSAYGVLTDEGAATGVLPQLAATLPAEAGEGVGDTLAIGVLDNGGGVSTVWMVGSQVLSVDATVQFSIGDGVWQNLGDPNITDAALNAGQVRPSPGGKHIAFKYIADGQSFLGFITLNDQ